MRHTLKCWNGDVVQGEKWIWFKKKKQTYRRKNSQAIARENERPACWTCVRTEFKTDVSSSNENKLDISSVFNKFVTWIINSICLNSSSVINKIIFSF